MSNQVALGKFGSPFGVKGWVKVISFTDPIEKILDYLPWCIYKSGEKILLKKINGQRHGNNLIVQINNCNDRDIAKTYTNLEIFVERAQLPEPDEEEYYWIDLVNLTVINEQDENLGKVDSVFSTGSNDVLVVKEESGKERLIPYLQDVILEVDLEQKVIHVEWDSTF